MITTIFFGVGGVLLSQGWDCGSRREATKVFHLDGDFEDRHERVVDAFERGELSLDAYLGEVVFNRARAERSRGSVMNTEHGDMS